MAPCVLIGWRVASFPSLPLSQWSRSLSCDIWAGQGRTPSLKEPSPLMEGPRASMGSYQCFTSGGRGLPGEHWGGVGVTGTTEWQHSKLLTRRKAHVSPFSEASAEISSEKLETYQLPTHPHPSWCHSVNRTGRWAVNMALL